MMKRLVVSLLAASLWTVSVGCDEATMSAFPSDLSKLADASRGIQGGGDVLRDQIRQQDQLRDGTGVNCPKSATAARGVGDQTRDQLRLQDGTGANCPK